MTFSLLDDGTLYRKLRQVYRERTIPNPRILTDASRIGLDYTTPLKFQIPPGIPGIEFHEIGTPGNRKVLETFIYGVAK